MRLLEIDIGHPLRSNAERLIRAVYALHYNAHVTHFPKMIIALADGKNRIHAAAGLRDFTEPFFSEHYLDEAIEQIIGRTARRRIGREFIVEVSSLASRTPQISVQFMTKLVLYGEELGYEWAFFTVTSRLETLLRRMRLPLFYLGPAQASRVPNPEQWGSYYKTDPRVLAFGAEQLVPFLMKQPAPARAVEMRAHG